MRRLSFRVGLSCTLAAAGLWLSSSPLSSAWGQQPPAAGGGAAPGAAAPAGAVPPGQGPYDEMPIPASLDERGKQKQELSAVRQKINQIKLSVNQVLTGEQGLAAQQRLMDGYYTRLLFPRLTLLDNIETPEKFNELYRVRLEFMRDVKRTQRPDVHDYLIRTALTNMTAIVKGNYHPAARYNAMLIIAELNIKEAVQTGTPSPPEPFAEALPPMVEALEDPNQLDAVRVAAMLGVLRHVQWDARQRDTRQPPNRRIDAAVRTKIDQYAVALIGAKNPPAGRTPEGHAWMQRRAIDILGAMGTLGTNVTVAQSVEGMVGDDTVPVSLRCTAAEALGQINLPAESNLDPVLAAQKLGQLAVFAVKREVKLWEDEKAYISEKRKMQGGFGTGGGAGGPGMMPGMGGAGGGAGAPELMGGGAAGGAPGLAGGAPGLGGPGDGGGAMPGLMPGMGGPGGMMPGMGGAMGGPATDKDAYRLEVAQRRTRSQMQCVKVGLAGVKDKTTGVIGLVKDDKHKQAIQKLADEVAAVRDLSESDTLTRYEKFMEELKNRVKTLEAATQTVVALNKPVAPAAADGPGADVPGADVPGADLPGAAGPAGVAPGRAPAGAGPAAGAPAGAGPAGAGPAAGAPAGAGPAGAGPAGVAPAGAGAAPGPAGPAGVAPAGAGPAGAAPGGVAPGAGAAAPQPGAN